MSKIKLLLDVVSDLRSLAGSLEAVANAMTDSQPEPEAPKANTTEAEKVDSTDKKYTLEEVRGVLSTKSAEGHGSEIRELLVKYGHTRLSEIDPMDYPALLADAEVL